MAKVLVLDAGHGLNTSGKQTMNGSKGVIKEWTLNSNVCNKIQAILKDYDVTIYRTDDTTGKTDVALTTRVSKTNSYKPDLFVSIHHNATPGATGTEVYWHTKGTAEDKKVAGIVAPKLASKCGMKNRGVKQASFAVLGCKPTAILVEGGFMDTTSDYEIITSDKGQQAYAEAVAESIVEYLGLKKVTTSQPSQPQASTPSTPSTSTSTSSNKAFTVKIICNELNIRKEASFDSAVVGVVKKGEVYTIVEEKNGLGRLKSGAGWISMGASYVEKTGTVASTSTPASNEYQVKIVNCTTLNVRKGAGTNYGVTTTVKAGEVYTIVDETNGWLKLKSGAGYISKTYTQKM